jgi:small subunit ribosomal protein S5
MSDIKVTEESKEVKTPESVNTPDAKKTERARPVKNTSEKKSFDPSKRAPRGDRTTRSFGNRKPGQSAGGRKRFDKRKKSDQPSDNIESSIIQVRRVSKTVKGGRNMRFSALIVAGDKNGKVGFGIAKGLDFQDAVNKATKKAKDSMVKIDINENGSINFPINFKYKSAVIYLKPANSGTGLIAGGFLRPVLQLAGVSNIYSKIIGTRNKVVGVRAAFEGLSQFYNAKNAPKKEVKKVEEASN